MQLMPKNEVFHTLFTAFALLLEKAADDLNNAIQQNSVNDQTAALMLHHEQNADQLGMKLYTTLHKSFVTPHDPEDIFALIHNLDDVMDGLEDIAHRIASYRITPIPLTMQELANHVAFTVKQIEPALLALDQNKDVVEACLVLKNREGEMDILTRQAIANLFINERDVPTLIKQKEVYEFFEATADACAQVATIIGRIHIKGG